MIPKATRQLLRDYAERYETPSFLIGDPSWFMHQVSGTVNQEAMAFLASCLSYGSRQHFMPKIQWLLDRSQGDVHQWIASGAFAQSLQAGDSHCYYRLFTVGQMHHFLSVYRGLLCDHGTLGSYVAHHANTGLEAVEAISSYFGTRGVSVVVPRDTQSACKRLCMFLRWMVRSNSPVDLGLWADFIDLRTLIMPLDTHVLAESQRLGLLKCGSATMSAARRLTQSMLEIFPNDPLKGDFALFGYGIAR